MVRRRKTNWTKKKQSKRPAGAVADPGNTYIEQSMWEIEKIVGERRDTDGAEYYMVRWAGTDPATGRRWKDSATKKELIDAPDAVRHWQFEQRLRRKNRSARKGKGKTAVMTTTAAAAASSSASTRRRGARLQHTSAKGADDDGGASPDPDEVVLLQPDDWVYDTYEVDGKHFFVDHPDAELAHGLRDEALRFRRRSRRFRSISSSSDGDDGGDGCNEPVYASPSSSKPGPSTLTAGCCTPGESMTFYDQDGPIETIRLDMFNGLRATSEKKLGSMDPDGTESDLPFICREGTATPDI